MSSSQHSLHVLRVFGVKRRENDHVDAELGARVQRRICGPRDGVPVDNGRCMVGNRTKDERGSILFYVACQIHQGENPRVGVNARVCYINSKTFPRVGRFHRLVIHMLACALVLAGFDSDGTRELPDPLGWFLSSITHRERTRCV